MTRPRLGHGTTGLVDGRVGDGSDRTERGAVLAEAALILPILILFVFGISEYGVAWRSANHVAKTLRNAATEAARQPTDGQADFRILQQLRQATPTSGLDTVRYIIVYRATGGTAQPPAGCLTAAATLTSGSTGVTGLCNVYSSTLVYGAAASQFDQGTCAGVDRWLCPSTRRTTFGAADELGVYVRWDHRWLTKIPPGDGLSSNDKALVRLAPDPRPK